MRTLVYHTGALGDFITILPALRLWKSKHPEDHLILLGSSHNGRIGQWGGFIDETWDIDRASSRHFFSEICPEETKNRLRSIDRAILFTDHNAPIVGHLKACGVEEITVQSPFPPEGLAKTQYHLSLFGRHEPIDEPLLNPLLRPFEVSRPKKKGRRVAMHPGSGSPDKNWPLAGFLELAELFHSAGVEIIWRIGPADSGIMLPTGYDVDRQPTLIPFLRAVQSCELFVGNDSGVSHCAAAVGCPTVVIFRLSDPKVWRPWGDRVICVKKPDRWPAVDEVWQACHDVIGKGSGRRVT